MANQEEVRYLRYPRLTLASRSQDGIRSTLNWSMRGNYPRITVHTDNDKVFKDGKPMYEYMITAPMDTMTLGHVLTLWRSLITAENGTKHYIDCLNTKIENGVRSNTKYVQATVVLGKDDKGIIFIAVVEEGKKKVKFNMLPNMVWFNYNNGGSEKNTNLPLHSATFTKNYTKIIERVMLGPQQFIPYEAVVAKPNIAREPYQKQTSPKPRSDFDIDKDLTTETTTTPMQEPTKGDKVLDEVIQEHVEQQVPNPTSSGDKDIKVEDKDMFDVVFAD